MLITKEQQNKITFESFNEFRLLVEASYNDAKEVVGLEVFLLSVDDKTMKLEDEFIKDIAGTLYHEAGVEIKYARGEK